MPPNVQDPATLKTPSGAVARYRGALSLLAGTLDRVMTAGALITDELAALPAPRGVGNVLYMGADSRTDLSGFESTYNRLHQLRAEAREARGFVEAYVPATDTTVSKPALAGHLYAAEAYAEVWLADLFCSGIPLSTVDFEGNYTLAPGSTTNAVYTHAAALFDSALSLAGDSVRVQQLAAVGKGRALLAVGRYAEAASAVTGVPDDYAYQVPFAYAWSGDPAVVPDSGGLWSFRLMYSTKPATPSVADREGQNGLDYRSSGDPRTAALPVGPDALGNMMYHPAKYPEFGGGTFTLASGVEARLIEAEAALQAGGGAWLITLNALRQTAGLADTTDPGTPAARVDLLFRERAFWLYLDGHRQGDLRRRLRTYPGYRPEQVYPTGIYPGGPGTYGMEVAARVPESERELNPKYTDACIGQNP